MTNLIRICIRDAAEYESIIWIEHITCTKKIQILNHQVIGDSFVFLPFFPFFFLRKACRKRSQNIWLRL